MMKKILIFINVFVALILSAQSLTNTENYVYSRTYLEPVTSSQSSAQQLQGVQYLDGLGRTTQNVSIKNTPTGKDLILPVIYDQNGKVSKNYLPLPINTLNGANHSGITENSINSHYGVTNAYSQVDYEKSPLPKVLKKSSVGDDWQINGSKTKDINYLANSASEVKKYIALTSWDPSAKINNVTLSLALDSLSTNGYYNANTLFKFITKDEDNNVTETFVNSRGMQVLKRKVIDVATGNEDTYYLYDQADNLVYIIPPAAAKAQNITQLNGFLNNLCYQYRYDKYNRLVESKLPGRSFWEYIVYDIQGRVSLTQDANQHNKAWSFVKYDKFDRPVYMGIYTSSSTRTQLQASLDNASYVSSNESPSTTPFNLDGKDIYYTKNSIPYTGITILSVNYYDEYPTGSPATPANILGANTLSGTALSLSVNNYSSIRSTKSLPTASFVRNLEDNNWTSSYVWYDQKGQVAGSHSINHLGGYTKTEMQLGFGGFPLADYTFHKRLDSDSETVIKQRYIYDDQKRLKTHYHQVNNNPEEVLAQFEYDELSRVKEKKVGGTSLSAPVETIDYSYNIQGWLTGINKQEFSNPTNRLFAYDIRYNDPSGGSLPKYNGNISEVNWKSTINSQKRYNYSYDKLDRLTFAKYSHPQESIPENDFYNESFTYDSNGNIKTLKRNAPSFFGNSYEAIDDLKYDYNGNKLLSVKDESNNPTGYEGGGSSIDYDSNGNMVTMKDRSIEEITYNQLDLASVIKFNDNKKRVSYLYRADGTKLKKEFLATGNNGEMYGASTEYIDGFNYGSADGDALWASFIDAGGQAYEPEAFMAFLNENGYQNTLKFIPTAEGFYDFENNQYIYQYKDHLGNARVSFLKEANGETRVVDQNDYYAFGMNHVRADEPSYFGFGSFKNYKYNGKELQETGMYDYGWRQYMPDLGKWNGMDQLSEMYHDTSPYAYVTNNPIRFTDPDGRCPQKPDGSYDCYTDIDEVVIGAPPKSGSGSSSWMPGMPSFLSYSLADYFGGSSGGGSSGGGGGGLAPDPYAQYKKDLEAYNIRQAHRVWQTAINETKIGKSIGNLETFLFMDIPMSFAGEGLVAAGWKAAGLNNLICRPLGRLTNNLIKICFTEGTLVATENGNKKIEDIKEGDLVWSYNERTGKKELKKVIDLSRNTSSSLVKIYVNGTEITCTPEHPFYVDGSWVEAKDLIKGMLLTTLHGTTSSVESINFLDEKIKVYNFEVEDNHNYYVSEKGILVHNNCEWLEGSLSQVKRWISTEPGMQNVTGVNGIDEYAARLAKNDPFVFSQPIKVVEAEGKTFILNGHHRIKAAIKMGYEGSIPYQKIPPSQISQHSGFSNISELLEAFGH